MPTTMNHTIPIPLPENPEASGTLTRLLQAMEANGLCVVKQAVIVETESWNTYRLIEEVLTPPEPATEDPTQQEKNGHANGHKRNVYHDPETGKDIHPVAMAAALKKATYPEGKRFTHTGKGQVEVALNAEESTFFPKKVQEA